MTLKKLIEKYMSLAKEYETVTLAEVIKDLRMLEFEKFVRKSERK